MKSIFFNLLVFFLFTVSIYGQNTYIKPAIYAVVVGIADYKDGNIPDLKFPENDAVAFYNFLRSPHSGSIPEENIALLTGPKATTSNILKEVVSKFSRSKKEDMIIFYFAGHGKAGFMGRGFLLGYDTDYDNDLGTAISMPYLNGVIDGFQAKLKLSYVDACHAGLFTYQGRGAKEDDNSIISKSFLEAVAKSKEGSVRMLASSAQQESLEDPKTQHGVFTYFLLKGFQGEADLSQVGTLNFNNGIITIGELDTYLSEAVPRYTNHKQRPSIEGNYNDLFPVSILKPNISLPATILKTPGTNQTNAVLPDEPVPTKDIVKKSRNPNCKAENTGDYCFQNNTDQNLEVTLTYTQPREKDGTFSVYTNFKSIIQPGQKQCFYNVPAGPGKYFINHEPGMYIGIAPKYYHAESTIYIDACVQNNFVITKNADNNATDKSDQPVQNKTADCTTGTVKLVNKTAGNISVIVSDQYVDLINNRLSSYEVTTVPGNSNETVPALRPGIYYVCLIDRNNNGFGDPVMQRKKIVVEGCKEATVSF